jgi:hypothetical protein
MKRIFFILSAVVVLAILLFTAYKIFFPEKTQNEKTASPGFWGQARLPVAELADKEEAYKTLMSLGYLQGYSDAPDMENVTIYDKNAADSGYNFYVSGHAPEAILMDMDGNVIHAWHYHNAAEIWSDAHPDNDYSNFWRRAHVFPNGDLLAIYNEIGLIKIDKHSNLLWKYRTEKRPHHALTVTDDGTIYVVTNERKPLHSTVIKDQPMVVVDYITVLSPDGSVVRNVPLWDLLEKSKYRGMINYDAILHKRNGDIMHTNSIEVFDGTHAHRSPIFKKGNVMVSPLWWHTIFIIDMDKEEVIWALGSGLWRYQHEPRLLDNGNILIFNNIYTFESSQVLEFNPFTQEIHWEYKGTELQPFFSRTSGSNQRLSNGNTLITETDFGRAFEITPSGRIVWEFLNPHRAGTNDELIATIPEMLRFNHNHFDFIE